MWIYLSLFAFELILLSWNTVVRRRSPQFLINSILIVLLPCVVAAFRGLEVGTDIMNYAKPLFDLASESSTFSEFYKKKWMRVYWISSPSEFEIGYLALVWISAKLIKAFPFQLFATELLIVLPIYLTALLRGENRSTCKTMMLFYILYYNMGLNMMRQWIAMSFVILAVMGVCQREGKGRLGKALLLIMGGCLFHKTAVLGLVWLIIAEIIKRQKTKSVIFVLGFLAATCILVVSLEFVRAILPVLGLEQYLNYLGSGRVELMPKQIVLRMPFLLIAIMAYINCRDEHSLFMISSLGMGLILSQLISLFTWSGRIGLYFDIASIFIADSVQVCTKNERVKKLIGCGIAVFCVLHWFYFILIMNSGETVPYVLFD